MFHELPRCLGKVELLLEQMLDTVVATIKDNEAASTTIKLVRTFNCSFVIFYIFPFHTESAPG